MTFIRHWGANMQPYVWSHGYDWPGFTYGPDDRAVLQRWAATVGSSFSIFVAASVVLFILTAGTILAVVWGPVLLADPAMTSAVTFFLALGAARVRSISTGFPLATIRAAAIASRFAPPFAPPEAELV